MRSHPWLSALALGAVLCAGAATAAAQQQPRDTAAERRMEEMRRRLEELELRLRQQEALLRERSDAAMAADVAAGRTPTLRDTIPDQRQRSVSGIYGRPFVRRFGAGTAVGGYMDHELFIDPDQDRSTFTAHRLIPFIFAEVTDRIHFGTELEFEYGGEEIKVEFGALDIAFTEWLNLRGGILLSPLGKFNLIHDSPVNDLTERPLVSRQIIPTTLSEAGLGFFGTVYPTEQAVVTYEAYLVNGFDERILGNRDVTLPTPLPGAVRVRGGRGSMRRDNNENKAFVGRLGVSPFLGLEVGGSVHTGVYAPTAPALRTRYGLEGDERLTIWALDGIFNRGPFELLGEFARLTLDAPAGLADEQQGYYVQGNVHFGHGWVPGFTQSVFTGVVRWDDVDFDAGASGPRDRRLTFGLNWRPVEETVLKFDWLHDWLNTDRLENANSYFAFSLATYF